MRRPFLALALPGLLLLGCASRTARENLRNCRWEVADLHMDSSASQVYRGHLRIRLENPTATPAILDSLWVDVATPGGPLAHLSHGGTLELSAGHKDSAEIHFEAVPSQLGMRMMEMLFAMPESLSVRGEARIPLAGGLFHSVRGFQAKVPASLLTGFLGSALRQPFSAVPQEPESAPDDTLPLDDDEDGAAGSLPL